jgi:hypothetical protein
MMATMVSSLKEKEIEDEFIEIDRLHWVNYKLHTGNSFLPAPVGAGVESTIRLLLDSFTRPTVAAV